MSPVERPAPNRPTTPVPVRRHRLPFAALLLLAAGWIAPLDLAVGQDPLASPPRNRCVPDPGHVECLDEHAGLVHGAVVQLPGSQLACRAFRHVWMRRYRGKSSRAETREVVVAGVCEQTAPDGRLIRRWSTVDALPKLTHLDPAQWRSLEVQIPPPVVRLIRRDGGSRKNWWWRGYYFPRNWDGGDFHDPTAPADFAEWGPLGRVQAFRQAPAARESVESPLFDRPVGCTEGYVVCSPYLTILHPDPSSPEVQVEMVSARRYFQHRTRHGKKYEHDATMLRQTFKDPGRAADPSR